MTDIQRRNKAAYDFVNAKILQAKSWLLTPPAWPEVVFQYEPALNELIPINQKGFRGVVLTGIVALQLNPSFMPTREFYNCHPRSIFENAIWYALRENNIPCGKSDPLNVAKNQYVLNRDWANGRRPQSAALAAVTYLKALEQSDNASRATLTDYFFFKLVQYAQQIGAFDVQEVAAGALDAQNLLADSLVNFALQFPEGGHIPQMLVGEFIAEIFSRGNVQVHGGGESVFGTNTTSNKPADIWTTSPAGIINLYEVTVKGIGPKRLDDAIDSLKTQHLLEIPVTFICRIPEDIVGLPLVNGCVDYSGKRFQFVDIRGFISVAASLISVEQTEAIASKIRTEITDVNISLSTKQGWNEIFGSL